MPPQPTPAQLALWLLQLTMLSAMLASWAWAVGRVATGRGLLPPAPIRVVPWWGVHVVGMLLLYVGVQLVVPVVLFAAAGVKPARGPGGKVDTGMLNLAVIAVNAAFLVVGPWLLMKNSGAGPSDFGIEPGKVGRDLIRGVVAWPLLAPIVFGVSYLTVQIWPAGKHPLQDWVARDPSAMSWGLATLSALVLAPAVEEFLFRGVLLGWLGRWASGLDRPKPAAAVDPDFGPMPEPGEIWFESGPEPEPSLAPGHRWRFLAANVAVSALFAAMHASVWPTPVPLFFLSLGLGVLYQRTGGLVAPFALHATFNGLSTLLLYLTLQANPGGLKGPNPAEPIPPDAVIIRQIVDPARHPRLPSIET